MNTFTHPVSGTPVSGIWLAPGTALRKSDVYDSSDGKWRNAPTEGVVIELGCSTLWVRPGEGLSSDGEELLAYLKQWKLLVTRRSGLWIMIPSLRWKHDGRMHWGIENPSCVQELLDFGFIVPTLDDDTIYEVARTPGTTQ